jgi:hypothetical protein
LSLLFLEVLLIIRHWKNFIIAFRYQKGGVEKTSFTAFFFSRPSTGWKGERLNDPVNDQLFQLTLASLFQPVLVSWGWEICCETRRKDPEV